DSGGSGLSVQDLQKYLRYFLEPGQDGLILNHLSAIEKLSHSNKNATLQKLIKQILSLRDIRNGKIDNLWPVAWVSGNNETNKRVYFQWILKSNNDGEGKKNSSCVIVSLKPLIEKISQQSKVRLFFGTMPNNMKEIASLETQSTKGEMEVEFTSSNGFFQIVASVGETEIAGPLGVLVNGERIFPRDGETLSRMLQQGKHPIDAVYFSEGGPSPIATKSVRIDAPGNNRSLRYEGDKYSVEPSRFYVQQLWLKRGGDERFQASTIFSANEASKKNTLSMVLEEGENVSGQWVYSIRAIPTFWRHTFWIPFKEVSFVRPFLTNLANSEIALFEMLEVQDWEYANDLARVAELGVISEKGSLNQSQLDELLKCLSADPLSIVDYHGKWIVDQFAKAGREWELVPYFMSLLKQTPNPLFQNPKYNRIFYNIKALAEALSSDHEKQWDFVRQIAEDSQKFGLRNDLMIVSLLLDIAESGEEKELAQKKAESLLLVKGDSEAMRETYTKYFENRASKNGIPDFWLFDLLVKSDNPEVLRKLLLDLDSWKKLEYNSPDRLFAELVILSCIPGEGDTERWKSIEKKAYTSLKVTKDFSKNIYFAHVLNQVLEAKGASAEVVVNTAMKTREKVMVGIRAGINGNVREALIANLFLVRYAAVNDMEDVKKNAIEVHINDILPNMGTFMDKAFLQAHLPI
ncbi:MAG: hypothetical protein ACK5LK_05750, partial [Chthoniobacterales bacterium]